MAFQNQPGCGCCGCSTGSMTATATGCGNSITSPTWTVKLAGVTKASATGPITASGLAPGTYDLDIDVYGYDHYHTTFTIDSSCNAVALGDLPLTMSTGFICCSGFARQEKYYFTDGNGTHELVWNGSNWAACGTILGYSTVDWSRDGDGICSVCTPATKDIQYSIILTCVATSPKVRIQWATTQPCSGTGVVMAGGTCNSTDPGATPTIGMWHDPSDCSFGAGEIATSTTNSYDFNSASVQTMTFGTPGPLPDGITGPYTMSR